MILLWILLNLAVIFDAISDALMKNSKWILSKTFQSLTILSIMGIVPLVYYMSGERFVWYDWLYILLMYGLIRVGLFNATWGITRFGVKHWNWYYIGRTSLWDRLLEWVCTKMGFPEKHFLFWLYFISWLVSIGVLFNRFYIVF